MEKFIFLNIYFSVVSTIGEFNCTVITEFSEGVKDHLQVTDKICVSAALK